MKPHNFFKDILKLISHSFIRKRKRLVNNSNGNFLIRYHWNPKGMFFPGANAVEINENTHKLVPVQDSGNFWLLNFPWAAVERGWWWRDGTIRFSVRNKRAALLPLFWISISLVLFETVFIRDATNIRSLNIVNLSFRSNTEYTKWWKKLTYITQKFKHRVITLF